MRRSCDETLPPRGHQSRWHRAGRSSPLIAVWVVAVVVAIPVQPMRHVDSAAVALTAWKVDPAVATEAEFMLLPGIGARRGERITAARDQGAVLHSPLDVARAAGLGERTARRLAKDLRWAESR